MPTPVEILAALQGNSDPDAMVLLQMVEIGADLRKPHNPDFAFEVSERSEAEAIAEELKSFGYETELYVPEANEEAIYQVVAKCELVLDLQVLNQLTIQFEKLAAKHNAIYDGWGAEIVE